MPFEINSVTPTLELKGRVKELRFNHTVFWEPNRKFLLHMNCAIDPQSLSTILLQQCNPALQQYCGATGPKHTYTRLWEKGRVSDLKEDKYVFDNSFT